MSRKAIFIAAYNRPKYLYVTLDSLRRCKGLGEWDLFVDFDGGSDADFRVCYSLLGFNAVHRTTNLGCMWHPTEILKTALHLGYDQILYAEDDEIFRTDMLDYLNRRLPCHYAGGLVSCWHRQDGKESEIGWVSNAPCVFRACDAGSIISFMEGRRYLGLPNVCDGFNPITEACKFHDIAWYSWCQLEKVVTYYAPIQYCLNFGLVGMNYPYKEHEDKIFHGPPTAWINEIMELFAKPEMAWWPRSPGFSYA